MICKENVSVIKKNFATLKKRFLLKPFFHNKKKVFTGTFFYESQKRRVNKLCVRPGIDFKSNPTHPQNVTLMKAFNIKCLVANQKKCIDLFFFKTTNPLSLLLRAIVLIGMKYEL